MTGHRALVFCLALAAGLVSACTNSTSVVLLIPVGLAMTPSDTFVPQGGSVQIDVTVFDTAGHRIPVHPTFSVSDSTLVSVKRACEALRTRVGSRFTSASM